MKSLSNGDFSEPSQALLGSDAGDLSATTVKGLRAVSKEGFQAWQKRSLVGKHYVYIVYIVYIWVDGV